MLKQLDGRIGGKPLVDIRLEDAVVLGAVFGSMLGSRALVVSGRDNSPVSRMFKRALTAGLMSVGCSVMDFHEAVSGEIAFSMKRFGAKGGFNIHLNPRRSGYITIRLYRTPGYELVGKEVADILSRSSTEAMHNGGEIGWVNYAEYMHELYVSALLSFVKSDEISTAGLNIVASHSYGALDEILRELLSLLRLEYTLMSSGRVLEETYPFIREMNKVAASTQALNADLGVVFNTDASALTVYMRGFGFLLPEELLAAILTRYPSSSNIIVDNYVSPSIIRHLEDKGYRVRRVEDEEKLLEATRRERPVLALINRGDFITPLFSLGYDALVTLVQLLEALSLQRDEVLRELLEIRGVLSPRTRSIEEVESMCSANESYCVKTLWGYRVLHNDTLYTYIYGPEAKSYLEFADKLNY